MIDKYEFVIIWFIVFNIENDMIQIIDKSFQNIFLI